MALAKHNLALLYEDGRGVRQDYARALKLYTEAAEAGEMRAAVNLGHYTWMAAAPSRIMPRGSNGPNWQPKPARLWASTIWVISMRTDWE